MTISVIGAGTGASAASGAAAGVSFTLPASIAQGDFLIAPTILNGDSGAVRLVADPTHILGWPSNASINAGGSPLGSPFSYYLYLQSKIYMGYEDRFRTYCGDGGQAGAALALRGVDPFTPYDNLPASNATNGSGTTITVNGVTPSVDGCAHVIVVWNDGAAPTYTPAFPTGGSDYNLAYQQAQGSAAKVAVWIKILPSGTAGVAIASTTVGASSGTGIWQSASFCLRPVWDDAVGLDYANGVDMGQSPKSSFNWNHVFGSGTNYGRVVVAYAETTGGGAGAPTITLDGVSIAGALLQHSTTTYGGADYHQYEYEITSPPAGSTKNIAVSVANSIMIGGYSVSYLRVDPASPHGTVVTGSDTLNNSTTGAVGTDLSFSYGDVAVHTGTNEDAWAGDSPPDGPDANPQLGLRANVPQNHLLFQLYDNNFVSAHTADLHSDDPTLSTKLYGGNSSGTLTYIAHAIKRLSQAASTFSDSFSDANRNPRKWATGYWRAASAGATVAEGLGTLTITTVTAAGDNYNGFLSLLPYDLTSSNRYVLLQNAGSANDALFFAYTDTTHGFGHAVINGTIFFRYYAGGSAVDVASTAYSVSTHQWLRVRHASGTVYWDTAPSTATNPPSSGDWVNQASVAVPSGIDVTKLKFALNGGSSTSVAADTVIFAGFSTAAMIPLTIVANPQNVRCKFGDPYSFSVGVIGGTGTVHYQWKKNGVNVGTDSPTYTSSASTLDEGSVFYCVVSDDNGSINSTTAGLDVDPLTQNQRKRKPDTTYDFSLKGWFSLAMEPKGQFDEDLITQVTGAFNASVSESGSAADTQSATESSSQSVSETASAADTTNRTLASSQAVSETASAADTQAVSLAASQAVAESASAADTVASSTSASGAVAESGSAADTTSGTMSASSIITETGAATDTQDAVKGLFSALTESGAAADTVAETLSGSASITEIASAADTVAQTTSASAAVVESGSAADTPAAALTASAAVTESTSATDTQNGSVGGGSFNGAIAESASAADTQSVALAATASLSESGSAADTVAQTTSATSTISETGSAVDTQTSSLTASSAVSETASAADTVSETTTANAAVAEATSSTDTVNAAPQGTALMSESASASDTVASTMTAAATVTETASASDIEDGVVGKSSAVTESTSVIDTQNGLTSIAGNVSESANATDTQSQTPSLAGSVAESASAVDTQGSSRVAAAAVTESGSAADTTNAQPPSLNSDIVETANAVDQYQGLVITIAIVVETAHGVDEFRVQFPYLFDTSSLRADVELVDDGSSVQLVQAYADVEVSSASDTSGDNLKADVSINQPQKS